ncbi:MAG: glycosyltransferase, YqgM-like family [Gemmatimonadetes bacterium]|nr:glycosyltransferase, YqgM-like family [Gemmatimonadota bacterium]
MSTEFRIVHAITPAEVGGLETAVRLLACGQRERGHSVHVLATVDHGGAESAVLAALRASGVPVTTIVAPGRAYLHEWRAVGSALAALQPHVLHTHGYRADLLAGSVARRANVPTVTTLHGFVGGDWKLRLYEQLQRRSLRRFDAVVAVSTRMRDELSYRVDAKRFHVIPNAFAPSGTALSKQEARSRLGIADGEFHLGWIGRLSHEKGPDVMIRALASNGARDAHLSVIGNGVERQRVEQLVAELGLAQRVTFHGVRQDAGALLAAFDGVVLSSRSEGTPIVLLEAIAAGVPVIATSVGGIPEVVQAPHALVVPPENPAAIAAAIAALESDPAAATERASRALGRLRERYAIGPWVAEYDRVYDGVTTGVTRMVA